MHTMEETLERQDMELAEKINLLACKVHWDNQIKGFWDEPRNFAECCALMHSELSEALEADRKNLSSDKLTGVPGVHEELADTVIRVLDYCGHAGIPIGDMIFRKLEYNRGREYKHGKNY